MLRWLSILLVALALVVAGCGGGSDEAGGDSTVTVTETTDTTDTDTTTDESSEGTDNGTSGIPSADCIQAVSAFGVLAQAAAGAGSGDTDQSLQAFEDFAGNAPDEIQNDLQVLASAYAAYIQKWNDLGVKQGEALSTDQIQALTEASAAFNTSEFQAASANWEAWVSDNCPS